MQKRKRKTLKTIKDSEIKLRVTSTKKNEIKEYCKKNNISMTDFIILAVDKILGK